MGIENIVSCDECGRTVNQKKENYMVINCKIEVDDNLNVPGKDLRHQYYGIYCLVCGIDKEREIAKLVVER